MFVVLATYTRMGRVCCAALRAFADEPSAEADARRVETRALELFASVVAGAVLGEAPAPRAAPGAAAPSAAKRSDAEDARLVELLRDWVTLGHNGWADADEWEQTLEERVRDVVALRTFENERCLTELKFRAVRTEE